MTTTLLASGATAVGDGITHTQVAGVKYLANLMVVLIRILQDRGIIDEDFSYSDGAITFNLDDIAYILAELGGSYTDPEFDEVEDA